MLDAIKPLLDSDLLNEDTRKEIQEAWETKVNEVREGVRAELREEFAKRYEHDKSVMVEALDRMVTESLQAEIEEIKAEKASLAEDRVRFNESMKAASQRFNDFMVSKLAEEIQELRADRKAQAQNVAKLENFVSENLEKEINEFAADKKAVVETKVRLVSEAKTKLDQIKQDFIKKSSSLVQEAVANNLRAEITQLKEDIQSARENNFGRKIFEAFATEFGSSYLNENAELRKLESVIADKDSKLEESAKAVEEANKLLESRETEIKAIKESVERTNTLKSLMKPLSEEKAGVMHSLLENVDTSKLKSAFDKYLPAVLKETSSVSKKTLVESKKAVTGDKQTVTPSKESDDENVILLKKLAGI